MENNWWNQTALDLTFLGRENQTRLAALASSPREFYETYSQLGEGRLQKDVQTALRTTFAYSQDFAKQKNEALNSIRNHEQIKKQMDESLKKTEKQLKDNALEVNRLESEIKTEKESNKALEEKLFEMRGEKKKFNQQIFQLNQTISDLRHQNKEKEASRRQAEAEIPHLRSEIQQIKQQKVSLEKKVTQIESKLLQQKKINDDLKQQKQQRPPTTAEMENMLQMHTNRLLKGFISIQKGDLSVVEDKVDDEQKDFELEINEHISNNNLLPRRRDTQLKFISNQRQRIRIKFNKTNFK
ncbi:MAG: hypothetical protein EZS28_027425 [Streblomastix strix]|uniref:Uncharacterized protein n=1 Tax=Streblomastix strix TaxID=222440 RepID=A0A5J4V2U0_9EUKA|nr:MAG: hypothetical protein EZS28_027425 [Streblomastix strix]